jgi:hypothetical protein
MFTEGAGCVCWILEGVRAWTATFRFSLIPIKHDRFPTADMRASSLVVVVKVVTLVVVVIMVTLMVVVSEMIVLVLGRRSGET